MNGKDDDIIPESIRTMADIPPPPPPLPPSSPLKSATTTPLLNTPKITHGDEEHTNTVQGGGGGTISTTTTSSTMASPSPASPSTDNTSSASAALLSPPLLLEIEEGTPAAEALRANADVRVSKLRKVGRSTKLQAGVRVLKSSVKMASGQPGHASDRRGAPAFVAPKSSTPNASNELRKTGSASGQVAAAPPTIPEVDDEGGDVAVAAADGGESSSDELFNNYLGEGTKIEGGESPSIIAAVKADQEGDDNDSFGSAKIEGGGESSVTSAEFLTQQSNQQQQNSNIQHTGGSASRHSSTMQHVTHAALPAAIAAACRAGEELDRQRATQLEKCSSEGGGGGGLDSASLNTANSRTLMSPFTSLFRSSANLNLSMEKLDDDDENGDTFNVSKSMVVKQHPRPNRIHIRSASVPSGIGVFRRSSMENQHRMPSEISVGAEETQRHGNLRLDMEDGDISDDDGDQMIATTTQIAKIPPSGGGDSPSKTKLRKHVEMDPIVVEIPGRRPSFIVEETKEEEEQQMALLSEDEGGEESESRKALMAKAKKKISRRVTKKKPGLHDDDAFHFHGPKQVRKWVKQRRHKEESKNQRSYVKGKVIDGQHELYTMSIAVMFGMRTSIGRTNLEMSQTAHNERRWLDNEDLMAVVKYEFPPKVSDPLTWTT